ncbi:MAG: NUDIX domain-containing protein, partial [Thermoplasmata archaeon]
MTEELPPRRFQRLRREADPARGVEGVVRDGMCLSAFVLLGRAGSAGEVLLGRIDPSAPWDRLGGLSAERVRSIGEAWMLPSSHLIEYEAPVEAARRVAREQLELPALPLRGPEVFSEAYHRPGTEPEEHHWDLHFVFRGDWPGGPSARAAPFRELRFFAPVELGTLEV